MEDDGMRYWGCLETWGLGLRASGNFEQMQKTTNSQPTGLRMEPLRWDSAIEWVVKLLLRRCVQEIIMWHVLISSSQNVLPNSTSGCDLILLATGSLSILYIHYCCKGGHPPYIFLGKPSPYYIYSVVCAHMTLTKRSTFWGCIPSVAIPCGNAKLVRCNSGNNRSSLLHTRVQCSIIFPHTKEKKKQKKDLAQRGKSNPLRDRTRGR